MLDINATLMDTICDPWAKVEHINGDYVFTRDGVATRVVPETALSSVDPRLCSLAKHIVEKPTNASFGERMFYTLRLWSGEYTLSIPQFVFGAPNKVVRIVKAKGVDTDKNRALLTVQLVTLSHVSDIDYVEELQMLSAYFHIDELEAAYPGAINRYHTAQALDLKGAKLAAMLTGEATTVANIALPSDLNP